MAFFLLGRTEDGAMSLLSGQTFESRQDALAELGRITGDPAFSSWDDEVMLIDLDAATPVLLVRPTAPASEAPTEPLAEGAPEPAAFAAIADEVPVVFPEAVVVAPETVAHEDETPEVEPAEEPVEPDAELPGDETEVQDALVPDAEPDAEPEDAAGPVDELLDEPVEAPVADVDEPVGVGEGDEAMDSLRDAIARTTEQMEASGIVAPDSIGAAPELDEVVAVDTESEAVEPDLDDTADASDAVSPAWPWSMPPRTTTVPSDATEPPSEIDVTFLLEGLEEPSLDDSGSLITSSIDDASLAASKPMILGAYGDDSAVTTTALLEAEALEPPVFDVAPEPERVESSADESDFIVLDAVPEPAEEEPISEPVAPSAADDTETGTAAQTVPATDDLLSLSTYTCEECVYVETCPNKDQRRPEDCGSFQWK